LIATRAIIAHDARMVLLHILQGLSSGLRLQESPLYRYPHRNAEESVRGDAKRIFADIEVCMERIYE
jgi:hypothetical protein